MWVNGTYLGPEPCRACDAKGFQRNKKTGINEQCKRCGGTGEIKSVNGLPAEWVG